MAPVHSFEHTGDRQRLVGSEENSNLTSLLSKSSIIIEGKCCTLLLFGILLRGSYGTTVKSLKFARGMVKDYCLCDWYARLLSTEWSRTREDENEKKRERLLFEFTMATSEYRIKHNKMVIVYLNTNFGLISFTQITIVARQFFIFLF